jgi:type I restriction enzyme, R subunit
MEEEILNINEYNVSQKPAVDLLEKLGYIYINEENNVKARESLSQVLLKEILTNKLMEINSYEYKGQIYKFSVSTIGQAIKDLDCLLVNGLISANESIYDMLTLGKSYEETMIDGSKRSYDIRFIDLENPSVNVFNVTEEFSVERNNGKESRPDIVLFVNGIPLVVIECKASSISVQQGISQTIRNQKPDYIPQLFKFAQIVLSSNKNETKYATCGTPLKFWSIWKEEDLEWQKKYLDDFVKDRIPTEQDKNIVSLFSKDRLLDLIKNYIIFENGVKKICRYQQYYAVREILKRISNYNQEGVREGGVVWHTQGSGKSITMAYVTKQIMLNKKLPQAQVVVVTDRVDLDSQIHKTFNKIGISASRASTGQNLVELIKNPNVRVITTVVDKFDNVLNNKIIVDSKDTFILIDEGHRTQYSEKNRKMREVFVNATYISFTGTPIMKKDKNIFEKFGKLIHKYSINDAILDKAIVPLIYEGKMIDQSVNKVAIDNRLDIITRELTEEQKSLVMKKWSRFEKVASSEQRLSMIAFDINEHFVKNLKNTGFNAMIACNSKSEAIKYYNAFEELGDLNTKVVISSPDTREGEDDIENENKSLVIKFYNKMLENYKDEKTYEDIIKSQFVQGDIDILIVVDKLLTGFDAPRATVLYLDKAIKEHNLLQAIARVNRLYDGKDYGYIVDYRGLLGELDKALTMYKNVGLDEFNGEDLNSAVYYIDSQIEDLHKSFSDLITIFESIKNKNDVEEYEIFLENKEIRDKFYDNLCTFGSLFGLIMQSDKAYYKVGKETINKYKNTLKFYQTLRRTVKIRYSESIDHQEYEIKMQKLMDNYVSANEVIRITNPVDVTNTEDFEKELDRIESKRGKADAIRTRLSKTITQKEKEDPAYYKKFSERIEETIEEYRNRRISDSEYLDKMQKIREDFLNGNSGIIYPENITEEKSRAFYGVIYDTLFSKLREDSSLEGIGNLAIKIKDIIESKIKRDWHHNPEVHNNIAQAIDEEIFMHTSENFLNVSFDEIDKIIENIIGVALIKY